MRLTDELNMKKIGIDALKKIYRLWVCVAEFGTGPCVKLRNRLYKPSVGSGIMACNVDDHGKVITSLIFRP